ncbi:MAG: S-layer homology domain-containing protein [Fimbriimonadaceae bacterium]|nr:S-layer homology domain-containing protein [Fimbriimonadaceae bacterium]
MTSWRGLGLLLLVASTVGAKTFSDVAPDHWAASSIEELVAAKVLQPAPDGLFNGSAPVARYDFAVLALRLLQVAPHVPLPPPEEKLPFTDVRPGHWATPAVAQLYAAGIVAGAPDGQFQGTRPLVRYDFVAMIYRLLAKVVGDEALAASEPERTFADVAPDHWASPALRGLHRVGVFPAAPDQTFEGARATTRYEFAVVGARTARILLATRPATE